MNWLEIKKDEKFVEVSEEPASGRDNEERNCSPSLCQQLELGDIWIQIYIAI